MGSQPLTLPSLFLLVEHQLPEKTHSGLSHKHRFLWGFPRRGCPGVETPDVEPGSSQVGLETSRERLTWRASFEAPPRTRGLACPQSRGASCFPGLSSVLAPPHRVIPSPKAGLAGLLPSKTPGLHQGAFFLPSATGVRPPPGKGLTAG